MRYYIKERVRTWQGSAAGGYVETSIIVKRHYKTLPAALAQAKQLPVAAVVDSLSGKYVGWGKDGSAAFLLG